MSDKATIEAPLERERSSPGLLLALLGGYAMRRLRTAHDVNDLKPRQFEILGLLIERGPITQVDLASTMATAPSILVTLLNPLEERGWINRTRDPNDRRRHLVEITKAGASRFRTASEAQRQVEDEVFSALDDEQRSQLRDLLLIVRDDVIGEDDEHCATPGSLENADG